VLRRLPVVNTLPVMSRVTELRWLNTRRRDFL
jgi:hypothetical protein